MAQKIMLSLLGILLLGVCPESGRVQIVFARQETGGEAPCGRAYGI